MNIGELIKELEKYDSKTPVCVRELEYDYNDVKNFIETHDEIFSITKKEEHYYNTYGNEVYGIFISIKC